MESPRKSPNTTYKKRVLSLDGGGIRGLASLKFLSCLEEDIGTPIYELFDLYAGTSIGSLIATTLLSRRISAQEMLVRHCGYDQIRVAFVKGSWWPGSSWFVPAYSGDAKRGWIYSCLPDISIRELERPFVVPVLNMCHGVPKIYDTSFDMPLRSVIDAATAAPTYFPAVCMPQTNTWEIDGGLFANNPSMIALTRCTTLWGAGTFKILSLGTGNKPVSINGRVAQHWGVYQWLRNDFVDVVMDTPMEMVSEHCATLLGPSGYLRINPDLDEYQLKETLDQLSRESYDRLLYMGADMYAHNRDVIRDFLLREEPAQPRLRAYSEKENEGHIQPIHEEEPLHKASSA